jgi:exodeoxyribonuclease-3
MSAKPPLTLATWNINSVRIRMKLLQRLAEEQQPDVICLQETKVDDAMFPHSPIEAMGYPYRVVNGRKGYHGVAILSRVPFEKIDALKWCEKDDGRHLMAKLQDGPEIHNFYIPAGGDTPDPAVNEKFAHKLQFLDEKRAYWNSQKGRRSTDPIIVVGDLNVAPHETDVWSHKQLLDVVSHTPAETDRFKAMLSDFEWIDVTRQFVPVEEKIFSWWSYRNRDWKLSDRGRRLDHVWASPAMKGAITAHTILRDARDWDKPSDHVPIVVTMEH